MAEPPRAQAMTNKREMLLELMPGVLAWMSPKPPKGWWIRLDNADDLTILETEATWRGIPVEELVVALADDACIRRLRRRHRRGEYLEPR